MNEEYETREFWEIIDIRLNEKNNECEHDWKESAVNLFTESCTKCYQARPV